MRLLMRTGTSGPPPRGAATSCETVGLSASLSSDCGFLVSCSASDGCGEEQRPSQHLSGAETALFCKETKTADGVAPDSYCSELFRGEMCCKLWFTVTRRHTLPFLQCATDLLLKALVEERETLNAHIPNDIVALFAGHKKGSCCIANHKLFWPYAPTLLRLNPHLRVQGAAQCMGDVVVQRSSQLHWGVNMALGAKAESTNCAGVCFERLCDQCALALTCGPQSAVVRRVLRVRRVSAISEIKQSQRRRHSRLERLFCSTQERQRAEAKSGKFRGRRVCWNYHSTGHLTERQLRVAAPRYNAGSTRGRKRRLSSRLNLPQKQRYLPALSQRSRQTRKRLTFVRDEQGSEGTEEGVWTFPHAPGEVEEKQRKQREGDLSAFHSDVSDGGLEKLKKHQGDAGGEPFATHVKCITLGEDGVQQSLKFETTSADRDIHLVIEDGSDLGRDDSPVEPSLSQTPSVESSNGVVDCESCGVRRGKRRFFWRTQRTTKRGSLLKGGSEAASKRVFTHLNWERPFDWHDIFERFRVDLCEEEWDQVEWLPRLTTDSTQDLQQLLAVSHDCTCSPDDLQELRDLADQIRNLEEVLPASPETNVLESFARSGEPADLKESQEARRIAEDAACERLLQALKGTTSDSLNPLSKETKLAEIPQGGGPSLSETDAPNCDRRDEMAGCSTVDLTEESSILTRRSMVPAEADGSQPPVVEVSSDSDNFESDDIANEFSFAEQRGEDAIPGPDAHCLQVIRPLSSASLSRMRSCRELDKPWYLCVDEFAKAATPRGHAGKNAVFNCSASSISGRSFIRGSAVLRSAPHLRFSSVASKSVDVRSKRCARRGLWQSKEETRLARLAEKANHHREPVAIAEFQRLWPVLVTGAPGLCSFLLGFMVEAFHMDVQTFADLQAFLDVIALLANGRLHHTSLVPQPNPFAFPSAPEAQVVRQQSALVSLFDEKLKALDSASPSPPSEAASKNEEEDSRRLAEPDALLVNDNDAMDSPHFKMKLRMHALRTSQGSPTALTPPKSGRFRRASLLQSISQEELCSFPQSHLSSFSSSRGGRRTYSQRRTSACNPSTRLLNSLLYRVATRNPSDSPVLRSVPGSLLSPPCGSQLEVASAWRLLKSRLHALRRRQKSLRCKLTRMERKRTEEALSSVESDKKTESSSKRLVFATRSSPWAMAKVRLFSGEAGKPLTNRKVHFSPFQKAPSRGRSRSRSRSEPRRSLSSQDLKPETPRQPPAAEGSEAASSEFTTESQPRNKRPAQTSLARSEIFTVCLTPEEARARRRNAKSREWIEPPSKTELRRIVASELGVSSGSALVVPAPQSLRLPVPCQKSAKTSEAADHSEPPIITASYEETRECQNAKQSEEANKSEDAEASKDSSKSEIAKAYQDAVGYEGAKESEGAVKSEDARESDDAKESEGAEESEKEKCSKEEKCSMEAKEGSSAESKIAETFEASDESVAVQRDINAEGYIGAEQWREMEPPTTTETSKYIEDSNSAEVSVGLGAKCDAAEEFKVERNFNEEAIKIEMKTPFVISEGTDIGNIIRVDERVSVEKVQAEAVSVSDLKEPSASAPNDPFIRKNKSARRRVISASSSERLKRVKTFASESTKGASRNDGRPDCPKHKCAVTRLDAAYVRDLRERFMCVAKNVWSWKSRATHNLGSVFDGKPFTVQAARLAMEEGFIPYIMTTFSSTTGREPKLKPLDMSFPGRENIPFVGFRPEHRELLSSGIGHSYMYYTVFPGSTFPLHCEQAGLGAFNAVVGVLEDHIHQTLRKHDST